MNIMNAILGAQDGQAVGALSQQFGLSQDQTVSALGALLPALAGGLQRNVSSQGGLEQLMSALTSGQHDRYLDEAGVLGSADTVNDGNAILGHILGSRMSAAPSPPTRRRRPASVQTCLRECCPSSPRSPWARWPSRPHPSPVRSAVPR
jgi:hypothetical protein